jgi:hypothetical protein
MIFVKKSAALRIAQRIVENTGLDGNLGIFTEQKYTGPAETAELLKLVMALSACNLVQSMKADFIVKGFSQESLGEITRDFVLESLREQKLVPLEGKKAAGEMRLEIMKVVGELQEIWKKEEEGQGAGSGPRYYCVKEVLQRLGGKVNYGLQDALFALMCFRHQYYIRYFKEILGLTGAKREEVKAVFWKPGFVERRLLKPSQDRRVRKRRSS